MAQDPREQNPPPHSGGRRMRQLQRIVRQPAAVAAADHADAAGHVNIDIGQEEPANAPLPPLVSSGGPASTRVHRNAQRMNTITQVASSGVGALSPAAELPLIAAQAIMSFGSAIFSHGMTKPERIIQIFQGILSVARMGLTIAMIVEDENCDDNKLPLCKADLIVYLLFVGVLTVSASVAESTKLDEAPSHRAPAP